MNDPNEPVLIRKLRAEDEIMNVLERAGVSQNAREIANAMGQRVDHNRKVGQEISAAFNEQVKVLMRATNA